MRRPHRVLDALTRTHVTVGRFAGIPVGLNLSWFPVFFLVAWSLATGFLPHAAPKAGDAAVWAAALLGTTLFFVSILAHEFGHALTARHAGIGVTSVTLFVLGGVSRIAEEPRTAWEELRIAAAGPIVSFATAFVFAIAGQLAAGQPLLSSLALYLVLVNAALALFNLLPALPLDGGRCLRALLWAVTGSSSTSTRWAAWAGRACGGAFLAAGVVALAVGALVPAGWLVLLGVFIERSAKGSADGIEVEIHVPTGISGLPLLLEETMDEARFRKHEAKVIAWRSRLDVLPRPGELDLGGDGPDLRRYTDERMRMYEILDGVDRGLRAMMTDEEIDRELRKLSDLYDEWKPASLDDGTQDGTEGLLAGRPERYAPDPEEVLRREPGSSIEV